jgi:putative endonuclease
MESGKGSWYIGQTSDLQKRIREHKNGYGSETTAKQQNWKCIYCEGYINHKDAIGRERYLKSGAGRRFLDEQLAHYLLERID